MTVTLPAAPPKALTPASHRRPGPVRRHSTPLTIAMLAALAYFLLPLFWLLVASTKSTQDLFTTFGLWFSDSPRLLVNIRATLSHDDGVFLRWLLNTGLYALTSAVGAALLAAAGGYGFAKFRFRGDRAAFNLVLGAIMVPTTALAIPTYLLFAKVGLVSSRGAKACFDGVVQGFGSFVAVHSGPRDDGPAVVELPD